MKERLPAIAAAEVVLPAAPFDATLAFFTERLGFHLQSIAPADAPTTALLSGHGLRVRLQLTVPGDGGTLRLLCAALPAGAPRELRAPNGTRIEFAPAEHVLHVPEPMVQFAVTRAHGGAWHTGRAGMRYRDLVPDRLGGHLIASHIAIQQDGPVPDYVHFHRLRLQLIYCLRGSAKLVYEDQGPPFDLLPGDCVLQPPKIRHRVLESRGKLEVLEVSCPAEHETGVDHELALPTASVRPERSFGGQRFVRSRAADARWLPWRVPGFAARDLGIAAATDGIARVQVVRAEAPGAVLASEPKTAFALRVLLAGSVTVRASGQPPLPLQALDTLVVPAGMTVTLSDASRDLQWLDVVFASAQ